MHYNIKYRLTLTYYSICHYYHYDYLLLSLYIIYYILYNIILLLYRDPGKD
jgi:hypothetical protein